MPEIKRGKVNRDAEPGMNWPNNNPIILKAILLALENSHCRYTF